MTEADWLTATAPKPMLEFLRGKASDRKLRLFAVACCRRVWHLVKHDDSQEAVVVAELHADGLVDDRVVEGRRGESEQAIDVMSLQSEGDEAAATAAAWTLGNQTQMSIVCHLIADAAEWADPESFWGTARSDELRLQCELLRDLFGNPFAPSAVDAAWLTSTVLALARGIYDGKAFDRLPILADALADAGCDNADLLSHCRGDGPHVRGCWAVDLLLGRQ